MGHEDTPIGSAEVTPVLWVIRRGNDEFRAPDIDTLRAWQRDGLLAETDHLFHPAFTRGWQTVAVVLQGTTRQAVRPRLTGRRRVWLLPLAGCAGLAGLVVVSGLLSLFSGAATKALAGPPALVIVDGTADDDGKTWTHTVRVVNVSDRPIPALTLNVEWKLDGTVLSKGFGRLSGTLKPGATTTLTATGSFEKRLPLLSEPTLEDFLPKSNVDRAFLKSYEQEEIMHRYMKQRETVEQANRNTMQRIYAGIDVGFTAGDGSGVSFKAHDAELSPAESKVVQAAFVSLQSEQQADEARRVSGDAARATRERQAREDQLVITALNRYRSSADSIMNDALSILRSKSHRYPSEEARFRANVEALLAREKASLQEQFSWTDAETEAKLASLKAEVLARWDAEVEQAVTGKSIAEWDLPPSTVRQ